MNHFFTHARPKLAKKYHLNRLLKSINGATMFLNPVDETEVKSLVLSSETKSSLDSDYILLFIIQQIAKHILVFIFNMSLKTG